MLSKKNKLEEDYSKKLEFSSIVSNSFAWSKSARLSLKNGIYSIECLERSFDFSTRSRGAHLVSYMDGSFEGDANDMSYIYLNDVSIKYRRRKKDKYVK